MELKAWSRQCERTARERKVRNEGCIDPVRVFVIISYLKLNKTAFITYFQLFFTTSQSNAINNSSK